MSTTRTLDCELYRAHCASGAPEHPLHGRGVRGETRQRQVLLDVLGTTHSHQHAADPGYGAHELYGALHIAGQRGEGLLAVWYGEQALAFLEDNGRQVALWTGLAVLALGAAYFWWRSRQPAPVAPVPPA